MGRQVMKCDIGVQIGLIPVGERVELHLIGSLLNHGQAQPVAAMEALAAGDPAIKLAQGAVKRQDLADMTAAVCIDLPEVRLGIARRQILKLRSQVTHIGQTKARREGLAIVECLAE